MPAVVAAVSRGDGRAVGDGLTSERRTAEDIGSGRGESAPSDLWTTTGSMKPNSDAMTLLTREECCALLDVSGPFLEVLIADGKLEEECSFAEAF